MEALYLTIVIFLFILAIFDLVVGVSNDAVNFLNSAIGSKAAPFKAIMIIAGLGILVGACLSNGMMDIARHGIYQPQWFTFEEIMCILLAVMLTDVVLLDVFNSMGMPTSTTVSMVFELLGGTVALAIVKILADNSLNFGELLNTDKALSVILAIFVSVAIAFFFGAIVQYLSRLLFTFNYKKNSSYFIGLFGGLATTAIIYFMLIKGLKGSSFMSEDLNIFIENYTSEIVIYSLVFFTLLMQCLHWLNINVFKVVILFGTFALALAFAGNDLVNFIGVPLAGYDSFLTFLDNNNNPNLLMESLQGSAKTPWYFLIGSGIVMVIALFTSKKAHAVVKTSLDLSRQEEGDETFGTSQMARLIVRTSNSMASNITDFIPTKIKRWCESRFNKHDMILEDRASFDLVRAAVNVVLAGLLIALGTSMQLPLSTTYVTFMVAMGSSLADKAWGRESAVYRITGVLSVIGGWFLTAGVAFFICFFVSLLIYYGGIIAIVALIGLAAFSLIRSQMLYNNKTQKEKENPTINKLMATHDCVTALELLRKHTREELSQVLQFVNETYGKTITAFISESFKGLRKAANAIEDEKSLLKRMKRIGTLATSKLDPNVAIEKGLYFYQGNDFASEIVYSVNRICLPCLEHIDNNFTPLDEIQKAEFTHISEEIIQFLGKAKEIIETNEYLNFESFISEANAIINQLSVLKKGELKRIQNHTSGIKIGMVYLTMIQEAQNIMSYTTNLLKVSKKFQLE